MAKRLGQLYTEELQRVTGSSSNYRSDLRVARYGNARISTETNALNAIASNQQNKDLDTYAEYEAASGLTEKYALSEGKRHLYEQGFYNILDQFRTALSAGSLNASTITPVGGTRTVTDTNSKISISGGQLVFATGEAANNGVWYALLARKVGLILFGQVNITSTNGTNVGWDTNSSGVVSEAINFNTATIAAISNGGGITTGTFTTGVNYTVCLILRSTGTYYFIKGGIEYPFWTLLYQDASQSSSMRPAVTSSTAGVFTAVNIRVLNAIWLPIPVVYDTFTRANGVLGSTETTGPDSQTTPLLAWTSTLGTWAIATNAAAASATSGGSAFATVNTPSADILIDANLTRVAGVCGVVLRYANSTNYIIAYHDGTNAKLDKVIAGSTTNVLTAVQAYSAGATLRVIAYGSSFRLFYNNVAIGAVGTIADAAVQTTTVHGLYTTDTGATFGNFQIFPRGTSNEYSPLDFF